MKLDTFTVENTPSKDSWATIKLELPAGLVERSSGKPISSRARATIYQTGSSDSYTLLTSGGHSSSNRWYKDITLEEAKAKASAWAARRYKQEQRSCDDCGSSITVKLEPYGSSFLAAISLSLIHI